MYDVTADIKLRYKSLSVTNFVYTFTDREVSCEIKISQSTNF